jgi:GT2 family glycosyltransferase
MKFPGFSVFQLLRTGLCQILRLLAGFAGRHKYWCWAGRCWRAVIRLQDRPEVSLYVNWLKSLQLDANYNEAMQALTEGLALHPDDVRLMTEKIVWADNQNLRASVRRYSDAELQDVKVDIIICVHNALDDVVRCLSSIQSETNPPFSIIIVDDASDPGTRSYLEEFQKAHDHVQVLRNDINLGYTRSANRGLVFAQSEWVLLLNSDTVVTAGWLSGLLACAARDRDVRAVGPLSNSATFQSVPRVRGDTGEYCVNRLPDGWSPEDMNQVIKESIKENNLSASFSVPVLNGFCILFHRPTIESLGYLDADLFPIGYGEENDLCLRLVQAGHRLVIATEVYVYHKKSASFGVDARKKLTREGVAQLKAKWSHYDYHYIADRISEIPDFKTLRVKLLEIEATGKGGSAQEPLHQDRNP